jgi:hypothetical protein
MGANDHRPLPLVQGRLQSLAISGEPQPEPGGQGGPASALLGCLAALSHLTRLTSLTMDALGLPSWQGGLGDRGAPARDVLRALPPGLKQVDHCAAVVGHGCRASKATNCFTVSLF